MYNLSRLRFALNVLLMIGLGTLEGVGVLMIIPLLYVTGIASGTESGGDFTTSLAAFIRNVGIELNLPIVLLLYISLNFVQSWLQRKQTLLNIGIMQDYSIYLTAKLFRVIAFAEWQLLINKTRAAIANTLINETIRVYSGINACLQLMVNTVVTAVQVSLAMLIAPSLTLWVLGGAAVIFLLMQSVLKEAHTIGYELSALSEKLFFNLTEHLNGIKEVKACGIEAEQVGTFVKLRSMLKDNLMRYMVLQTRTDILYRVGATVFISAFLYSAVEVFKLSPWDFILIAVIASRLWPRISALQQTLQNITNVAAAFVSVSQLEKECLASRENISEAHADERVELKQGIEFRDVSFYYDEARASYALQDVNLSFRAGTTTAIVGVSGSGKSTMVDLLIGLLQPKQGAILADGVPLTERLRPWRNSIGYVPQDAFLSNVSIRENLQWFCPNAGEEDIWSALRVAAIDSLVASLPEGLETVIGDRGVRLSGGERQRIVLARALLRKPSILILDEATSSLDSENEQRIQQAIEGLQGKLTIVVIAHRLSTVRNADTIVVLEQGKIVEKGDYQSLMAIEDGRFRALSCLYNT
jgi:ATP-binding cassette subfamily C protein